MKKTILIFFSAISMNSYTAIELLDRVAVIVDDGLIMQSQIDAGLAEIVQRYDQQNILKPNITWGPRSINMNFIIFIICYNASMRSPTKFCIFTFQNYKIIVCITI